MLKDISVESKKRMLKKCFVSECQTKQDVPSNNTTMFAQKNSMK